MTREQKINALIENSDRKDLVLLRYCLEQKSDARINSMFDKIVDQEDNADMEMINS